MTDNRDRSPSCTDPNDVSVTVKAFITAHLPRRTIIAFSFVQVLVIVSNWSS